MVSVIESSETSYPRWFVGAVIVLASSASLAAGLLGCSSEDPEAPTLLASESCYYPPLDVDRMARELTSRDVSFSRDGDCLTFAAATEVLCAIELAAFGEVPPSGRSINRSSESASETVKRLAESGVAARIVTYAGKEYATWSDADAERAEEALNIPLERREVMKRMREEGGESSCSGATR